MEQKKEPFLSVIVPVYNVREYLSKCIESIARQTFCDMEIILVDDGSTDGSGELCDQYAGEDHRIKVIHRQNGGLVSARKAGVQNAVGQYITYVDGDDWIERDAYERLICQMGAKRPDMVAYGLREDYPDRTVILKNSLREGYYEGKQLENQIYPYMLCGDVFYRNGILPNVVAKLIRREILLKSQMTVPDGIQLGEDAACTFETLLCIKTLLIIRDGPYHYRKRQDSMMSKDIGEDEIIQLYDALHTSSLRHGRAGILEKQIAQYMYFVLLLKRYDLFLNLKIPVRPFGSLRDCKIAIYGAGGFGQEIHRRLQNACPESIALWVDSRYHVYREQGLMVQPVEAIQTSGCEIIIIAVLNTQICEQIRENLLQRNIDNSRIRYVVPDEITLWAVRKYLMGRRGI